ncbi:NAD(P)H-binding protein [Glycomyces mayteni]|uniref:NAD(P)H-binding protein n=1 Tax=Glycomyces mayteni TaxID=543887 RepID=A0ABW2D6M3_9ACTN
MSGNESGYLVAGATGNVGAEVVRALAARGLRVKALVRDAGRAALPDGVEAAVGDLDRPESLEPWLGGVAGAFLLPGFADMPGVYERLRGAGVERVVQLSGSSTEVGSPENAVTAMMIGSEAAARESGLRWTVLRPSGFMSNTLRWLPQLREGDVVRAPWGDVPVACIDAADIAAVAAAALTGDGHDGQVYRLSGPRAMVPAEQVAVLGEVLGRPLRFEGLTLEETRAELEATMPEKYVRAFWEFYADGVLDESVVFPDVERVTGRPPRTFEEWARAHSEDFA